MRLGLVIYGSIDTVSGGYRYDREIVARLRREGDSVDIFSLRPRPYALQLLDGLAPGLRRGLRAATLDVLLEDELNHPSLWLLRRRGARRVVSIVHHLRCHEPRARALNGVIRRVERRYLRGVDGFVLNSETTRRAVEELAPGRPSVVAPPGADHLGALEPARIQARAREPGPLRLLSLGSVIPRKGLLTVLEGLRRLDPRTWTLDVVGSLRADPAHARRVRAAVAALPAGQVTLHGELTQAEVEARLRAAQALLLPSYEGYGIAYLEAAAHGLPAVASRAGAAREVVEHGVTGALIAPGDAAALADQVRRWAGDRALLERQALAARRRFAAQPTWDETAARIRDFLRGLLA